VGRQGLRRESRLWRVAWSHARQGCKVEGQEVPGYISDIMVEDVFAFIEDNYSDPLIKTCLAGIYKCRRGLGDAVLTAWLYALEAQVKP
jgi:hypothetical protein